MHRIKNIVILLSILLLGLATQAPGYAGVDKSGHIYLEVPKQILTFDVSNVTRDYDSFIWI